jgi:hypothetical protein
MPNESQDPRVAAGVKRRTFVVAEAAPETRPREVPGRRTEPGDSLADSTPPPAAPSLNAEE